MGIFYCNLHEVFYTIENHPFFLTYILSDD